MKVKDKLMKTAMKLAGGVFALTLMMGMGITAQAKEVTVNSASELQNVLEEAKDLTETLTVTIPAGSDITIERFLYIYSDTVINADGAIIRNTNSTYPIITHPDDAPSNVTINGGTWEAGGNSFISLNGASSVTVKGATVNGSGDNLVVLTNCQKVTLDGCKMSGGSIVIGGGSDNAVKGGSLTGTKQVSIQINSANGTVVDGVDISNSANNAVLINSSQNVQITNNTIENSNNIGIESIGGGNHTISRNKLSNSGYMGIRFATDQKSVISGNELIGNAVRNGSNGEGLVVDYQSDGTVISGNTVQDTKGIADKVGNGIIVNRSTNIIVNGNTVESSANHGIQVSYESKNVTVSENKVSDSGRMGISVSRGAQADLKTNTITNSASRGIAFDGHERIVSGSIEGCTIGRSKEQGIYIESAIVSMSGNTIANSGTGGMAITGGSTVTADKNQIYQDDIDNTYGGISVVAGSNLTMNSNIISNFATFGVLANADCKVIGSNNQVNLKSGGFKDSNGAYRIHGGSMSSNTIFAHTVGRTSTAIETELSGYPTGVVINGKKYETTGDRNITVTYEDTDPANVIAFTQDAQGNAICMQAPYNFDFQKLSTSTPNPVPDNGNREQVEAFVGRIYTVAMGRPADVAGLKDWTDKLVSGTHTGAEVAQGFFFSPEFINKKLSDEEFVDTLYRTMFDREADEGGRAGWLKALYNGASREYVYHGFAESEEFDNLCNKFNILRGSVTLSQNRDQNIKLTEFVSRVYYIALNRKELDEAGINDWCGKILKGDSPASVVWGIVFSKEFTNRGLDNEQFITVLYKTYFDREASQDPDGFKHWMDKLQNGESRQDIVNGFSASQEFYNLVESFGL